MSKEKIKKNIIKKQAQAGSIESSDVLVTVAPNKNDRIEIEIDSPTKKQFGSLIKKNIQEVLNELKISSITVYLKDKGALESTIKARVETAVKRAL